MTGKFRYKQKTPAHKPAPKIYNHPIKQMTTTNPTREAKRFKARANVQTGSHEVGTPEAFLKSVSYMSHYEDDFAYVDDCPTINPLPKKTVIRDGEGFMKAESMNRHYKELFSHGFSDDSDDYEEY
jgi:hypothetical protein